MHTKLSEKGVIARPTKLGQRSVALIGNTPLLRLEQIAREFPHVQLLGKAEWYNPGGSVKDRAAFNIVAEGRRGGKNSAGLNQWQHRDRLRNDRCGRRFSREAVHA